MDIDWLIVKVCLLIVFFLRYFNVTPQKEEDTISGAPCPLCKPVVIDSSKSEVETSARQVPKNYLRLENSPLEQMKKLA